MYITINKLCAWISETEHTKFLVQVFYSSIWMFISLLITVRWFWFVISGSGQTVSRGSDSRHVWEDLHSHWHESVRLQQALPPPATKILWGKVRLVTYTSNENLTKTSYRSGSSQCFFLTLDCTKNFLHVVLQSISLICFIVWS